MPKRVEFDAPEGWVTPEGHGSGDDVEAVASIRIKPDGRLCIVELDGIRMPGFRDDEDDGKGYADAAADQMTSQNDY